MSDETTLIAGKGRGKRKPAWHAEGIVVVRAARGRTPPPSSDRGRSGRVGAPGFQGTREGSLAGTSRVDQEHNAETALLAGRQEVSAVVRTEVRHSRTVSRICFCCWHAIYERIHCCLAITSRASLMRHHLSTTSLLDDRAMLFVVLCEYTPEMDSWRIIHVTKRNYYILYAAQMFKRYLRETFERYPVLDVFIMSLRRILAHLCCIKGNI